MGKIANRVDALLALAGEVCTYFLRHILGKHVRRVDARVLEVEHPQVLLFFAAVSAFIA